MASTAIDLDQIAVECRSFITQFQSLQLATVSPEGVPEASYAPYVQFGRDYYVYVSELSRHTRNLASVPRASVLFIENEVDAKHLFARRRLTFSCRCEEISRESEHFEHMLNTFEEKFGDFMAMLRNLEDFHLFRVTPEQGTYVAGFARAFELIGENLDRVRHINDTGHRAKNTKTAKQMQEQVRDQVESA